MIIVEIYVPYLDKKYEFKLNEDVAVSDVIDDICSVISEKEQIPLKKSDNKMMLFNIDRGSVLSCEKSLYESNIANGDKLVLA